MNLAAGRAYRHRYFYLPAYKRLAQRCVASFPLTAYATRGVACTGASLLPPAVPVYQRRNLRFVVNVPTTVHCQAVARTTLFVRDIFLPSLPSGEQRRFWFAGAPLPRFLWRWRRRPPTTTFWDARASSRLPHRMAWPGLTTATVAAAL